MLLVVVHLDCFQLYLGYWMFSQEGIHAKNHVLEILWITQLDLSAVTKKIFFQFSFICLTGMHLGFHNLAEWGQGSKCEHQRHYAMAGGSEGILQIKNFEGKCCKRKYLRPIYIATKTLNSLHFYWEFFQHRYQALFHLVRKNSVS